MNPSSSGWIDKFLREFDNDSLPYTIHELYPVLRNTGFIYGTTVDVAITTPSDIKYSEEEKTKISLFTALVITYFETIENGLASDCVAALLQFYGFLDTKKSFFNFMNVFDNDSERLEKVIHTRIQTNESALKKNFSHILTNALLFTDVLAFEHFLVHDKNPFEYAEQLEETITNMVFLTLNSKQKKDEHDELLIHLFSSSVRYNNVSSSDTDVNFDTVSFDTLTDELERKYILDLCCMAVWNDRALDDCEQVFMATLGTKLQLSALYVKEAILHIQNFISKHKGHISFFNYSNPAQHFYKQTTKTVSVLILRNKNRLIKEIIESKDLVILLGQSTIRDLSVEEKQQVKQQLLDICKTIPSLAIFILPGGGLLLPLLVKFIPKLLPSAFNDNK